MAARVFNHLVAADMRLDQMVDALRDLHLFEFDEVCLGRGIIADSIDKLSSYRALINLTPKSFWSEILRERLTMIQVKRRR